MTAANGLPTLKEELDRKVADTLDWLVRGVEGGKLTKEQASTGLDTLFMAVSGLVDGEFIHIITSAQDYVAGASSIVKKHFHAPASDETVTFTWMTGEDRVMTRKRVGSAVVSEVVKRFDDAKEAAGFMDRLSEQMEKKGWVEL